MKKYKFRVKIFKDLAPDGAKEPMPKDVYVTRTFEGKNREDALFDCIKHCVKEFENELQVHIGNMCIVDNI